MTDKILEQIVNDMDTKNAEVEMFNALLSAEAQILQNQTVMLGCFKELMNDDKHRDLLAAYIAKNDMLIDSMIEVVNQNVFD